MSATNPKRQRSWASADAAKSQAIDVTSGTGEEFRITGLDGIPDNQYKITSEEIKPGSHYRIHITPQPGVNEGVQTLILKTDSADPRDQAMAVFLHTSRTPAQTAAAR